ncbi:MAG TPA: pyridine nucleotide-disulfide oxidoreductase, partial [Armatimonadota bacterium]|nr:pyridine nucleotide-disulfide oxidoreductase [Armatimonadota bacterium]
ATDEDVLAAGDVAEHRGVLYGNWIASQYQGKIAGMNAVGLDVEFGGIPRSNTLKVVGVDMLSIGMVEPEDGSYEVVEGEIDASYYRFVFHDGRFVGSVLLGDTSLSGAIKKAIEAKAECSGIITGECAVRDVLEHLGDG